MFQTGSFFFSAVFGLSWDYDAPRGLMRMSCGDGRELLASAVADEAFDQLVAPVGARVFGRRGPSALSTTS